MATRGFFDAGMYKVSIQYNAPTNEESLSNKVCEKVREFASECNGTLETRNVSTPQPELLLYDEIFAFINRESCLRFAQQVGTRKATFAIEFQVDFPSLQALL